MVQEFFKQFVTQSGWLPFVVVVYSVAFWFLGSIETSDSSRKRLVGWLWYGTASHRYRTMLRSLLNWTDEALSPSEKAASAGPVSVAWSSGLLKFTIGLAFLYPFVFAFGVWCLGDPDQFLSVVDVVNVHGETERAVLFVTFCLALLAVLIVSRKPLSIWMRAVGVFVAFGLFMLIAIFLAEAPDVQQSTPVVLAIVVLLLASHPLATISVACAIIIGGAAGQTGVLFIFLFSVAFFLAFLKLEKALDRPWQQRLIYIVPLAVPLALLLVGVDKIASDDGVGAAEAFVILLLFLPMANAIADFASAGLTRYLLRRGVDRALPFAAVYDLLSALMIFVCLAMSAMIMLAWVNAGRGMTVFPLDALLNLPSDGLAGSPEYWFALTLLTTLLPTLFHVSVVLLSLVLTVPENPRIWVGKKLVRAGEGDVVAGRMAKVTLATAVTFAVFLPAFVLVNAVQLVPSFLVGTYTFGHTVLAMLGL